MVEWIQDGGAAQLLQDCRRQAHKLERLGIDLAEEAGLVWPWPPSQLERRRAIIPVSDTYGMLPGDRLVIGPTAEQIRIAAVTVGQAGVTLQEAGESFRAFARQWRKLRGNVVDGPWPGE